MTGMQLLQYGTSFLALSQLLLTAMLCLVHYRHRRLGKLLCFVAICLMATIVAIISSSRFEPFSGQWSASIGLGAICVFVLFFNLMTLRLHMDSLQRIEGILNFDLQRKKRPVGEDKLLIERICHLMEAERLYAQPGLTIGALASRVGLQEYRLRRLINTTLRCRNFNRYLNQYRIAEAARRLQNREEILVPIATIAQEAGFAALSSFNKAFKETHGVTPSVFRGDVTA